MHFFLNETNPPCTNVNVFFLTIPTFLTIIIPRGEFYLDQITLWGFEVSLFFLIYIPEEKKKSPT